MTATDNGYRASDLHPYSIARDLGLPITRQKQIATSFDDLLDAAVDRYWAIRTGQRVAA